MLENLDRMTFQGYNGKEFCDFSFILYKILMDLPEEAHLEYHLMDHLLHHLQ